MQNGLLIVISGPSAAGKGTIYNAVLERMPQIKKSISVTTRAPRPNEIDGIHYHFKTLEKYQEMIASGEFLETAAVYNNFYGTPKEPVFDMLKEGHDIMFEVDVLGARQIKKKYNKCISVFVMTPSFKELEQRLRNRNTETEDSIKTRIGSARNELAQYEMFDYIVFNDILEDAINNVINIIKSEKCKISRNENTIKNLLDTVI